MKNAEGSRLPKWPLRLALSLLIAVEIIFVVMFVAEPGVGNIPIIVNSVGLLVFCVLTWLAIPLSRWFLAALLVWRVVGIGISLASHFGDHRTDGSLMLIAFYVAVGLVIASPLGRVRLRAAT